MNRRKRSEGRPLGRADSRKSRPSRLFWVEGPESRRLEERALLTLSITSFPIPLVEVVQPQGIATGPDGNVWFTEAGAGRIGRMTPAGALTEFNLPSVPPPAGSGPGSPEVSAR